MGRRIYWDEQEEAGNEFAKGLLWVFIIIPVVLAVVGLATGRFELVSAAVICAVALLIVVPAAMLLWVLAVAPIFFAFLGLVTVIQRFINWRNRVNSREDR